MSHGKGVFTFLKAGIRQAMQYRIKLGRWQEASVQEGISKEMRQLGKSDMKGEFATK